MLAFEFSEYICQLALMLSTYLSREICPEEVDLHKSAMTEIFH